MFGPLDPQTGPGWLLYHDDCVARMAQADENSVDAICTDPPYHLSSVTKRLGNGQAPIVFGNDGAYRRAAAGFMGKTWDGGDVAFNPETWAAAYRLLKPGGYLAAFGGSRTYHRMVVAIEDAGFVIHPCVGWVTAQGFPKAHNLARSIDTILLTGKMRTEDMRRLDMGDDYEPSGRGRVNYDHGNGSAMDRTTGSYQPKTPQAEQWQGWYYGGQARKPALEPICIAQKPFSERNGALNVLRWGVGAVNIDGCRVHGDDAPEGRKRHGGGIAENHTSYVLPDSDHASPAGRWPANLTHSGEPEVLAMFPDSNGSGSARRLNRGKRDGDDWGMSDAPGDLQDAGTGSAARFFNCYPPDAPALIYHAKASKTDRAGSRHPTVKPQGLMRDLVRHICPPGGIVLDPFCGSGSTLQAARSEGRHVIGIEADATSIVDTVWRMRHATQPD